MMSLLLDAMQMSNDIKDTIINVARELYKKTKKLLKLYVYLKL